MALASGEDPALYIFKQDEMRQHLFRCLRDHHMSPFPHSRKVLPAAGDSRIKTRADFPVYCICRMPEIKNVSMIECEKCLGWFHTSCETVDQEVLDKSDVQWICHSCNT